MPIEFKFKTRQPPMKLLRTISTLTLAILSMFVFGAPYLGIEITVMPTLKLIVALISAIILGAVFIDLKVSWEEIGILTAFLSGVMLVILFSGIQVTGIYSAMIILFSLVVAILELKTLVI